MGCKHFIGEGNGNPLQYSCLENPMGRGIWKVTVHGVAKSQTRLSDVTSLNHFILCSSGRTAKISLCLKHNIKPQLLVKVEGNWLLGVSSLYSGKSGQSLSQIFIGIVFSSTRKHLNIPPGQGLEPWTLRLKVWCSTDWATQALRIPDLLCFSCTLQWLWGHS